MSDAKKSQSSLRGMILAAGYGTRLAPVTDHIPKPLLPLGNTTLLDKIIDAMDAAGVGDIAVNTHHLGEQIADHLAARADASRFHIFPENKILGTGGALDGARSFLSQGEFFLLHNGDVLSDLDLDVLVKHHERQKPLATLALADWPAVNSVVMANDGNNYSPLLAIADMPNPLPEGTGRALTYSGIGVFSREILNTIGSGFSSIITPLVQALASNPGCVQGYAPHPLQWDDLGNLSRWLSAWDKYSQQEKEGTGALHVARLTGHGSDRKFWRLVTDNWSAVAVKNPEVEDHPSRGMGADPRDEFNYFTAIGKFLHQHHLGAPEFLSIDEGEQVALMEDLGTTSLYTVATAPERDLVQVHGIYKQVVGRLIVLQEHTPEAQDKCPQAVSRCLDEGMLHWETNYFRKNYLVAHLGMESQDVSSLDASFQTLAKKVSAQPKVLLHRDFQSQNIMLQDGQPKLVDFQGMRLGPLGYDVMSLAFDPYVDFSLTTRWNLVDFFCEKVSQSEKLASFLGPIPHEHELLNMATEAGLQRLMQALGAYSFLGHVKGKTDFLDHIPRAQALLVAVLARHRSGQDFMNELGRFLA